MVEYESFSPECYKLVTFQIKIIEMLYLSFQNLLTLDSQGNKSGGKKLGRVATSIGFGKKDGMVSKLKSFRNFYKKFSCTIYV